MPFNEELTWYRWHIGLYLCGLSFIHVRQHRFNSSITDVEPSRELNGWWRGGNQITDIKPLVDNAGLSDGIWYTCGNPLSETSIEVYIPQLEERGVIVYWTPPEGVEE
jgi:hypothetical protein